MEEQKTSPLEDLDLHLTRLATWKLQTIGQALLYGIVASFVCAVLVALLNPALAFAVAGLVGPLVIAWRLAFCQAPMPLDVE